VGAEHAGTIMAAANTRATARMLVIAISLELAKKAESIARFILGNVLPTSTVEPPAC
jgi:hypothetical protein